MMVSELILSELPFLSSLASSESAKDRRVWLRVATDYLLAAEFVDPGKIDASVEAVVSQLNAADPPTRLELARKLAPCSSAPSRVLAALTAVPSEACDYVLEHAVAAAKPELEQAVAHGGRRAIAVAKRRGLDPRIASAIAAQDDTLVLIALAENGSARLEGAARRDLVHRARRLAEDEGDGRLAEAVLERQPVWPESASLFLCARPSQRVGILLAAQRRHLGRPSAAPVPIDLPLIEELELAAIARQPDRFLALFAEAMDCGQDLARRIVDDPTGEPLAVALSALGVADDVLVRILISGDLLAGTAYQRIGAPARLNEALNRNAARMVMAALRDQPGAGGRRNSSAEAAPVIFRDASAGGAKRANEASRASQTKALARSR